MSSTATPPIHEVAPPDVALVVTEGQSIVIIDQRSYDAACTFLTSKVNPKIKEIDDFFDKNIKGANDLHKSLIAQKKTISEPVANLKKAINTEIIAWDDEQAEKQREAQRQAEEAQRLQDEEFRIANAVEVEQQGGTQEEVNQVLATPVITHAPVAAPVYQKASGISVKVLWRAEIKGEADKTTYEKSMRELCAAIGRGEQPVTYVEPNLTALNQIAKAQREAMNVPGVKAVSNKSAASRRT